MKKKLTVLDRANLLTALTPITGDIDTMEAVEQLHRKLEFTSNEIESANIQIFPNNRMSWNEKGAANVKAIDVDFNKTELDIISGHIDHLNINKQVNKSQLPTIRKLWEKPDK